MGWFSTDYSTDYLKLDILMQLNITARSGRGAIRWTPLAEHPKMSQTQARIALAALNYGRLVVNQRETGTGLFRRVSDAAERLARGQKEFAVLAEYNFQFGLGLSKVQRNLPMPRCMWPDFRDRKPERSQLPSRWHGVKN